MLGPVLVLEHATARGSIAVVERDAVIAHVSFTARDAVSGARSERLGPAVSECMAAANVTPERLTGIVCGAGPGSFTSLRCAASLAKGMCMVLGIPLYAVPSLELMAWGARLREGDYVAVLGAGRGEWFASVVRCGAGGAIEASPVTLVNEDALRDLAVRNDARLVGPGFDVDTHPDATAAALAMGRIEALGPVDLDAWEPSYGRLAEAQVKWEAAHGRPLSA